MADTVEVSGLKELRETMLKRLPEALQGRASQAALAKAAKPIVDMARQLAPVRKPPPGFMGPVKGGALRKAIYSFRNPESTKTNESRFIGVRRGKKGGAWYWKFIEFGRGVVKNKRLKDKTRSKRLAAGAPTNEMNTLGNPQKGWFGKEVAAVPARPFLRPAFEANKERAIEIFKVALAPAIEKVAQQAQRRTVSRIRKAITGL